MYHLRAFLRLILLNSQVCPLGEVVDYFIRLEFQLPDTPHAYILLWVRDPADFNTADGITHIDIVVTCSIHEESDMKDLVSGVEMQKPSNTCFKKKSKECPFHFPTPLSTETRILTHEEAERARGTDFLKRAEGKEFLNNYTAGSLAALATEY